MSCTKLKETLNNSIYKICSDIDSIPMSTIPEKIIPVSVNYQQKMLFLISSHRAAHQRNVNFLIFICCHRKLQLSLL